MNRGVLDAVSIASNCKDDSSFHHRRLYFRKASDNNHHEWVGTSGTVLFQVDTDDRELEVERDLGSINADTVQLALKPFGKKEDVKLSIRSDEIASPYGSTICKLESTEDDYGRDFFEFAKRYLDFEGEPLFALRVDILETLVKALKKSNSKVVYFTSENKRHDEPLGFFTQEDEGNFRGVIMPCAWE